MHYYSIRKKNQSDFLVTLVLYRWFSNVQKKHCKNTQLFWRIFLVQENLINIYANLKRELFSYLKW